jgi:hypothetical protein
VPFLLVALTLTPALAPTLPLPLPLTLTLRSSVVAAVGDSITVGATCNTWHGGYVKIMQDVLGDKYDVRDCGTYSS